MQQQQQHHFMVGMGRVSRDAFLDRFDMGYPRDWKSPYNAEVLILYGSPKSLPFPVEQVPTTKQKQPTANTATTTRSLLSNAIPNNARSKNEKNPRTDKSRQKDEENDEDEDEEGKIGDDSVQYHPDEESNDGSSIPYYDNVEAATANCRILKIVQTDAKPKKPANAQEEAHKECIAIVGQWSSYHVQKWQRLNRKHPLRPVPTHYRSDVPSRNDTVHSLDALHWYWSVFPSAQAQLAPLAYRVARGNGSNSDFNQSTTASQAGPIIVMVANAGQVHFWINFVCAAKARHLDLSRVLLFATDATTYAWVQQHTPDIAVFYHEQLFATIPQQAAVDYHDINYGRIMMAKVYCVHLINSLGYDVLFQDLDVVWYQHPLQFFEQKFQNALNRSSISNTSRTTTTAEDLLFDMYFQRDGAHHPERFAPLAANTGFYYVRYNAKTEYFWSTMVRRGDLVLYERSHQAALTLLVNEHMHVHGLRVQVMDRDDDSNQLLSGFHYHVRPKLLRKIRQGRYPLPYIFHANWLVGKDKVPALRKTWNWFVKEDTCPWMQSSSLSSSNPTTTMTTNPNEFTTIIDCCLAEPVREELT